MALRKKILDLVREEINLSFEISELKALEGFDAFFCEIDIQNAYEEEWTPKRRKQLEKYYLKIFNELTTTN